MNLICDRCGAATEIALEQICCLPSGRIHTTPCSCCGLILFVDDIEACEHKETPG